MHFCPTCGNMLALEREEGMRFFCRTCPYIYQLKSKVKNEAALQHNKLQNDPLGGPDAWKNAAESDETNCGKCGNDRAYFQQLQIRAADEPMTTFYKCVSCGLRWQED